MGSLNQRILNDDRNRNQNPEAKVTNLEKFTNQIVKEITHNIRNFLITML